MPASPDPDQRSGARDGLSERGHGTQWRPIAALAPRSGRVEPARTEGQVPPRTDRRSTPGTQAHAQQSAAHSTRTPHRNPHDTASPLTRPARPRGRGPSGPTRLHPSKAAPGEVGTGPDPLPLTTREQPDRSQSGDWVVPRRGPARSEAEGVGPGPVAG